MIKIKCLQCGKEFKNYPSNRRKFCSRKCGDIYKIGKCLSGETKQKLREKMKGNTWGFKKGHPKPQNAYSFPKGHKINVGRIFTDEVKRKMRGKIPWNKEPINKCKACGKVLKQKRETGFCQNCFRKQYIPYNKGINNSILIKCDYCGKEIKQRPSQIKIHKKHFCSLRCCGKWFSGKTSPRWSSQERICLYCGKKFLTPLNTIKANRGKYCSRNCFYKDRIGKRRIRRGKMVKCQQCGKEFYCKPCELRNNRRFCSGSCRGKMSGMKGKRVSETTKQKMRESHINHPNTIFKDTSIELKIEKELIKRNINYQKQVPLCKITRADFYLPEYRIVIQCDGCYWHNCPLHFPLAHQESWTKDTNQDKVLTTNGFKVYRLGECEINYSVKDCIDRIRELT